MKLWKPFKWDKANHFIYGLGIYIILRLISIFILNDFIPDYICLLITTILGAGIEVYQDYTKTGTASYKDYLAVIIGCLIPYIIEINFLK